MSSAAQPGYAPPSGPQPPEPGRRWPRWLVVSTVAWAVLLAGLTWYSARNDPPTVREQRSMAQAAPRVNGAVGELVAAASGTVYALLPEEFEQGCRVTPFSEGAILRRHVELAVPPGEERAALERVADGLPPAWRAGVRLTPEGPRLRADAGEFVAVQGRSVADGRIRLTVETGCRPNDADSVTLLPLYSPGVESTALNDALTALGAPLAQAETVMQVSCPGGAVARTVRVTAGPATTSPQAALAPLAGGTPAVATPELYAYRRDGVSVLVEVNPDGMVLSATTGCAG
ncbi:hypothetical protein E0H26_06660 [Micromonospora zingiberis]|uniref:Uncharacterized protein n=1 Tax=Micromonospora zingiberis TaxID=2053011 RepID=A0A4R0GTQ8_9ACTN|nr:hypothetical protein [Micromonospora zingiberis]TCB99081.1 hypothetical protein E0H26_06660 [Micromonospora zingiberis]